MNLMVEFDDTVKRGTVSTPSCFALLLLCAGSLSLSLSIPVLLWT